MLLSLQTDSNLLNAAVVCASDIGMIHNLCALKRTIQAFHKHYWIHFVIGVVMDFIELPGYGHAIFIFMA